MWISTLVLLLLSISYTEAWYVPGISPTFYAKNDPVTVFYNKIVSDDTQLPYAIRDLGFFCQVQNPVTPGLNLGEVLQGDRLDSSGYQIKTLQDSACQVLCRKSLTSADRGQLKSLIKDKYHVQWQLDGLPAATVLTVESKDGTKSTAYVPGFDLGSTDGDTTFVNNHVDIILRYNRVPAAEVNRDQDMYLIVGFEIYPSSIKNDKAQCKEAKSDQARQSVTETTEALTFTYSVSWKESKDVSWNKRWDAYLTTNTGASARWFSIVNAVTLLFLFSLVVGLILVRALNKDISLYNNEDYLEDQDDSSGWKMVHGDVFRPPKRGGVLAPLLGVGIQLLIMATVTLTLAALGFLNPSVQGGLLSWALSLFVLMSTVAGYYSARIFKTFRCNSWRRNAVITATFIPGVVFGLVWFLNFFLWADQSSTAMPFGTMIALFALWLGVSLPLALIGAYFGFRKAPFEHPVRTHQIPRQVPEQPWYNHLWSSMLIGGALPFAVIFIELHFILDSIWRSSYYYVFGTLLLLFVLVLIACIEISVIVVYFLLCAENHKWWWRAFLAPAASAFYVFLYGIYYYATQLQVTHSLSTLVYFSYMLVVCLVIWCLAGTVGFFASYLFVRKIYSAVKID